MMDPEDEPSRAELEAMHCWDNEDRVPGRPAMTAFRRLARLHQASWREANGHPIGSQPMRPKPGKPRRPVGSRLDLAYAERTGANFLTPAARTLATERLRGKEPHQSLDAQRLSADLLWSTGFAANLFADLAADPDLADQAIHAWWPDVPDGRVVDVRFLHSPGWLDPDFLGNLISLHVVFVLDLGDDERGVLGVTTRYHERQHRNLPKPERLPRYLEVAERSNAFGSGAVEAVDGTDLLVLWLEHLLVHSMVQHPSGDWSWGRLVLVHPEDNVDVADQAARYRAILRPDDRSFVTITLEQLLATEAAIPSETTTALRDRYVPC
jgi:hypothetical protein